MPYSRRPMFNVWLIASGKEGADLEEALRMNALGHNLTMLPDERAFESSSKSFRRDSEHFPNLLMYLIGHDVNDGTGFLQRVKQSADYRHVPVIVFYPGNVSPNVHKLYGCGAASVIRVPIRFSGLVELMRTIDAYWFNVASPPPVDGPLSHLWDAIK